MPVRLPTNWAMEMFGLKVVAVSDSKGGIYQPDGLDFAQVSAHKAKTGSVINFPGAKNITNEELLELDVTVLIPSALENAINEANASTRQGQDHRRTGEWSHHA